jgi:hypothetical protein
VPLECGGADVPSNMQSSSLTPPLFARPGNSSNHASTADESNAQLPFDVILDRVIGSDPTVTDYILEMPAKCPNCRRDILKKPSLNLPKCPYLNPYK